MRWIATPHDVEPKTAMPAVGLDEKQARDVAAYLYTLRQETR
jgi:cytochrome c1